MVHGVGSAFRGRGLLKVFQLLQQLLAEALLKHGEAVDSRCSTGHSDITSPSPRRQKGCDVTLTCCLLQEGQETISGGVLPLTILDNLLEPGCQVGLLRTNKDSRMRPCCSRNSAQKYLQAVEVRVERLVHLLDGCSSLCRRHPQTQAPVHFLRHLSSQSKQSIKTSSLQQMNVGKKES